MRREQPLAMQSGHYTLTRRQVAERLGISLSTVRRMEFVKLTPVFDADGVWRFDASEVAAIEPRKARARRAARRPRANAREGQIAATVFSLFEQRASLTEIVIAMKLPPTAVLRLYRAWRRGLRDGATDHPAGT